MASLAAHYKFRSVGSNLKVERNRSGDRLRSIFKHRCARSAWVPDWLTFISEDLVGLPTCLVILSEPNSDIVSRRSAVLGERQGMVYPLSKHKINPKEKLHDLPPPAIM